MQLYEKHLFFSADLSTDEVKTERFALAKRRKLINEGTSPRHLRIRHQKLLPKKQKDWTNINSQ